MKYLQSIILSLCILVVFSTCKESNDRSDAPIPPKEMQAILFDIHTAEYYSQGLGKHTGTYMKEYDSLAQFYSNIFAHHHIDMEQFTKAIDWYKKRPAILDSLYVNIKEEATALQEDIRKKVNNGLIIPKSTINTNKKVAQNDTIGGRMTDTTRTNTIPVQRTEQ